VLVSETNISGEPSLEFKFLGGQVVPAHTDAEPLSSTAMRHYERGMRDF